MTKRHLYLLGVPRVDWDDGEVPRFRSQRTIALLGYLVAERRALTRTQLAALFWPDEPADKGKANLRRELHNLAQILPDCWAIDRLAVQFVLADVTVDLFAFQEFEQTGQWTNVAALVDGQFLEGLDLNDNPEFETWLLGERERWRQRAEQVLRRVIDSHIQQTNYAAALDCTQQLLQLSPWHEEAHRHMMRLLSWTDQRAEALRQYQLCVDILETELDVPPDSETTRLFDEIREGKLSSASMAGSSLAMAYP